MVVARMAAHNAGVLAGEATAKRQGCSEQRTNPGDRNGRGALPAGQATTPTTPTAPAETRQARSQSPRRTQALRK
jgi:hypothetical protein